MRTRPPISRRFRRESADSSDRPLILIRTAPRIPRGQGEGESPGPGERSKTAEGLPRRGTHPSPHSPFWGHPGAPEGGRRAPRDAPSTRASGQTSGTGKNRPNGKDGPNFRTGKDFGKREKMLRAVRYARGGRILLWRGRRPLRGNPQGETPSRPGIAPRTRESP